MDLDIYKDTKQVSPLLSQVMQKIIKNNSNLIKINRLLHCTNNDNDNRETNHEVYIDVDAIEQYIQKKEKQIVG